MMTQQNLLERYETLHELGRGAIGRVYMARDRSTGAVVALKTLDPALFSVPDAGFAELFLKDARSAARLRHRNIVKFHDAGEAGGTAYVATELLEGESLRSMLDERPLSIARAIQIFDDIASALAYAHEEGVVHRGVKPSSITVLRSGVAKIGDFGIGRLGEAALLAGQRDGCLSYMSPEQLRGDPVDHRSDLFSLGAVFYEMLTRRAPFEGNSAKQISENILHTEPPLPSKVNPHVPFALDRIVFSMLAAHPDDRFANARVLLRDLQRLEEELGLGPGASAAKEPTASVPRETSFPPRGEPKPAAPQPATKREPGLRTPEPNRLPDAAPTQEAPRFAQHGQARGTSGLRFLRDSSPAEEFQHRSRTPGGAAFDQHAAKFMLDREREPERSPEPRAASFAAFDEHDARFIMDREAARERSSGSRAPRVAALVLLLAALPIGYAGFLYYSPGKSEPRTPASRMQEAPAAMAASSPSTSPPPMAETAPPPVAVTAPPPVAVATKEPATTPAAPEASPPRVTGDAKAEQEPLAIASAPNPLPPKPVLAEPSAPAKAEPSPPAQETPLAAPPTANVSEPPKPVMAKPGTPPQAESLPARVSEQPAKARTAPAQVLRAAQSTGISEAQPGGTAKLIIAVAPQGELYINGKHYGTTPPITTLDIEPGMHRIEIRSGSRKPFLTYMTVEAGEQRRIRHDFAAKPIRPPT